MAARARRSPSPPAAATTPATTPAGRRNAAAEPAEIRLWLNGTDTPQALRDYLVETFAAENQGSTLVIEEQDWNGLVPRLQTALASEDQTPDLVEIGNTQCPTFTYAGAFADISDMYDELGGDDLLPGFVEAGTADDTVLRGARTTPAPARSSTTRTRSRPPASRCRRRSPSSPRSPRPCRRPTPAGRPASPASGSPARTGTTAPPGSTRNGGDLAVQGRRRLDGRAVQPRVDQEALGRGPGPLHRRHQRAARRRLQRAVGPVQQRRVGHVLRADLGPVEHRPAAVQQGRRPRGRVRGGRRRPAPSSRPATRR